MSLRQSLLAILSALAVHSVNAAPLLQTRDLVITPYQFEPNAFEYTGVLGDRRYVGRNNTRLLLHDIVVMESRNDILSSLDTTSCIKRAASFPQAIYIEYKYDEKLCTIYREDFSKGRTQVSVLASPSPGVEYAFFPNNIRPTEADYARDLEDFRKDWGQDAVYQVSSNNRGMIVKQHSTYPNLSKSPDFLGYNGYWAKTRTDPTMWSPPTFEKCWNYFKDRTTEVKTGAGGDDQGKVTLSYSYVKYDPNQKDPWDRCVGYVYPWTYDMLDSKDTTGKDGKSDVSSVLFLDTKKVPCKQSTAGRYGVLIGCSDSHSK